jgi:uncharacterized repeat protein (TIGR04052 family)
MKRFDEHNFVKLGIAMTAVAALVAGCGGGDSSPAAPVTSVSGRVADGYVGGATVCLDLNANGACGATEPKATTNASGMYTISDLTAIPAGKTANDYAILAAVPVGATDADASGGTVSTAYVMVSPPGKGTFVSPLTTLVQARVAAGATVAAAETAVKAALGLTTAGLFEDFIAKKGTATAQTNEYVKSHEAAKVAGKVIQDSLAALATTNPDAATLKVVTTEAETVLAAQKIAGDYNVANVSATVGTAMPGKVLDAKYDNTANGAVTTRNISIDFGILATEAGATSPALMGADICGKQLVLGAKPGAAPTDPTTPISGQIRDLRFYISNVQLVDHYGNTHPVALDESAYQSKGVALLDFENSTAAVTTALTANQCLSGNTATNTKITGKVLSGPHYHGVTFTLGVPSMSLGTVKVSLNHSDATAAPAPLMSPGMAWSWQSGRKFAKIEFIPVGGLFTGTTAIPATTPNAATWFMHLGATGCNLNPATGDTITADYACAQPNVVHYDLDNGAFLDDVTGAATQKVVLSLLELFKTADLTQVTPMPPGCMSGQTDTDCPEIFKAFQLSNGHATGTPSTVFLLQ